MLHRQNGLFALWMALAWAGCAGDHYAPQDAGPSEDAAVRDAASPPTDAAADAQLDANGDADTDAMVEERDPTILRNFSFDDAKPLELGSGHTGLSCLTSLHGWVASGEQFVAFDDTTSSPHVLPGHEMVGCDATSVLLRQAGHRYSVCSTPSPMTPGALPSTRPACRVVELAAGGDAIPGLTNGLAMAVASRQKVLAVWIEKQKEARYFVLPATFKPKLVHANAKALDVLGETDDGLAIARVTL
jgi:hypothetical protein